VGEEPTNKWNRKILEEESFLVPSQLSRAVDFSRPRFLVGVSTPIRSASSAHWICSAELRRVRRPRPAIGPQPTAATATRRLASPAPSSTSVSSRRLGHSLGLVFSADVGAVLHQGRGGEQFVAVRGFGVRLL